MNAVCEQPAPQIEQPVASAPRMDKPEVYYDVGRQNYWIKDRRNDYITINETSLKRHLRACGYSLKVRDGERLSDLETCLNTVQSVFNVAYAGPLAGYQKGPVEMCGQRILVTSSPKLIEPRPGPIPVFGQLLQNMFPGDQLAYLVGWLKVAYESLQAGHLRPGQVLVLAGERNSGKSLLQNLITEILGGRAAKPYRYMSGATDFNGDLFGAEHLMIEDEVPSTNIGARRGFGARIKEFTVTEVLSCHAKNRQAISLKPFWRVSVSLNDEPENLLILPPFDESLVDKIILLKVSKAPLPMPTRTDKERKAFLQTLRAELPAFLAVLNGWEIPEHLQCERFGVRHFHHPDLLEALNDLAPETKLMTLIDLAFTEGTLEAPGFDGTAEQLQMRLVNSQHEHEVKRLLEWTNALGTYLGRLAKKHPDRVKYIRTSTARGWRLEPPPPVG